MILDAIFGLERRSKMVITGAGVGQDATLNRVFGPRGETVSGVDVVEDTPMTVSAWYAAIKLLAWTTGFLPLFVYRRLPNGDREPQPDNPSYRLLHDKPNPNMNAMIFRELGIIYTILWGNSYSWIERNVLGQPMALWPLHPRDVEVERAGSDGSLIYDISRMQNPPTSKTLLFAEEVLHVPGLGFNGIIGQSLVSFAAEHVGEALSAQQFASGHYANGPDPILAVKSEKSMTKEAKDEFRRQWYDIHADRRRHIALLDRGKEFQAVTGLPLKDLQYIEARQFMVTDAARWLGIPPHKIADLMRATFSNIAEQNIEFVQALLPWMRRFEQEYNAKLFPPGSDGNLFVEHVVDGLLAADPEKRANAFATGLQNGYLNRNEVRRLMNLNSMGPEGNVYTVQSNMTTIEKLLNPPDPPPIPPQFGGPPEAEEESEPTAGDADGAAEEEPEEDGEEQRRSMLVAAARPTFSKAIARMVRKEIWAIRKAAKEPRTFVTWLDGFYKQWPEKFAGGIRATVESCRRLGLDVNADKIATEHCKRSRSALLELSGTSKGRDLALWINREVAEWQTDIAETVTANLFDEENSHD